MSKKSVTIKHIADSGECPCSICGNQNIKVEDNFSQIGKESFTRLALLALKVSKSIKAKY